LEEHHDQEDQASTADDDDIARTKSLRACVRGKACKAGHSGAQQRPTGINASQEENAQRWEMSGGL
jgi:hypothetical protein